MLRQPCQLELPIVRISSMSLNNSVNGRVVRAPSVVSQDIKIVMLGESNVGKTCMCARFIQGKFLDDTRMTIGATYSTKIITIGGGSANDAPRRAKLQIWDTAGQERFRSMARLYFREAKIGIVCFDITDKLSLNAAEYWVKELRQNAGTNILIALAANKSDLAEESNGSLRNVSEAEAIHMAQTLGVRLFTTSAVTGVGIVGPGNMFETMVEELYLSWKLDDSSQGFPESTRIQIPERPQFGHDSTEGREKRCC